MINLELYGIVFLLFFISLNNYSEEEYSLIFKLMDINFWILLLIVALYLIILSSPINYKLRLNILLILIYFSMIVSNWVSFYIIYEIIFIFTIFAIILIGYRFERLFASYLILFYSFLFSRPILITILIINKVFFIKEWLRLNYLYIYLLVFSFIVKFPIFGFHYWLPVAHVEASTVGRIILARILLKIGGIGLFYVIFLLKFIVKFHWLSFSVTLGILIVLNLRDLKIIIAYSSVAHIRIVFYIFNCGSNIGKIGGLIIIFNHGVVSPLIFWIIGLLSWWKTRSILVVKIMTFSYLFILLVFLLCIINIRFPPFLGFLREILMLKSLVRNVIILYAIRLRILIRCYYNIYLFWCFNRVMGRIFKLNLYSLDVLIFISLLMILNF